MHRHPLLPTALVTVLLASFGCDRPPNKAEITALRSSLANGDSLTSQERDVLSRMLASRRALGDVYDLTTAARQAHWRTFVELSLEGRTTARARTIILEKFGPSASDPTLLKAIYGSRSVEGFQGLAALRALYTLEPAWATSEFNRLIDGAPSPFSRYEMWQALLGIADPAFRTSTRKRLASTHYPELVGALSLLVAIGPEQQDRPLLDGFSQREGLSSIATAGLASLGEESAMRATISLLLTRRVPGFLGQGYPSPITRLLRRQQPVAVAVVTDLAARTPPSVELFWVQAVVGTATMPDALRERLVATARNASTPQLASKEHPASTFVELDDLVDLCAYLGIDLRPDLLTLPLADAQSKSSLLDRFQRCSAFSSEAPLLTTAERAACVSGMYVLPDPPDIETRLGFNMWTSRLHLVSTPLPITRE